MQVIKKLFNKLFGKNKSNNRSDSWRAQAEAIWKSLDKINATLDKVSKEQELFIVEMQKLSESQAKTDKEIDKLRASQVETDRLIKEISKEHDKEIDRLSNEIGGGLCRVAAEGLATSALPFVFKEVGIDIKELHPHLKAIDEVTFRPKAEIDLFCIGQQNGLPIGLVGEIKAHVTKDDVAEFIKKRLVRFKELYPNYATKYKIIGFIAGIEVSKGAEELAKEQGLYILVPSGETMRIANPPEFKPTIW